MSVRPEFFISLQRTFNISYEAIFTEERLRELSRIGGDGQHIVGDGQRIVGETDSM